MPLSALEPLDRSSQPARFVVLDDLRLQVDRVEHPIAHLPDEACTTCLGSGQQVAAEARWRGQVGQRALGVLMNFPVVSVRLCELSPRSHFDGTFGSFSCALPLVVCRVSLVASQRWWVLECWVEFECPCVSLWFLCHFL